MKLRHRFGATHEVLTVRQLNWLGRKNGELLALMQTAGLEALLTGDKNMGYQQNWQRYPLPVILLNAVPKTYANLLALVPQVLALLAQPSLPGGVHEIKP